ncbi:hypothetical protein AbraIFM66950_011116 [Aspergillus brasiliensis]|nr:hypothetical protein AbraIFM66950_011116 [Aspergillus brasiliensis]
MSTSNHVIYPRVHEYESRSDSAPTTTELTLQARVGLALGVLGAIMLTIILTSLIVLRIQRGPSITLWTLFSRKPIPKRRQDESAAAGLSDEEARGTSPPPAYTNPLPEETPEADTVIQPQQAHIPPSLRKELDLHIDTTHSPRISATATATTTKQKPAPLRTMSDTEILRSSTSSEKEREAHSTLKVQIHHHRHHNHPYYNRLKTGSPRSPAGTGSGSSGTRSDRLYPPEEYAVPPDSPDVIVLPSPRELQKFRINVYR